MKWSGSNLGATGRVSGCFRFICLPAWVCLVGSPAVFRQLGRLWQSLRPPLLQLSSMSLFHDFFKQPLETAFSKRQEPELLPACFGCCCCWRGGSIILKSSVGLCRRLDFAARVALGAGGVLLPGGPIFLKSTNFCQSTL